MLNPNPKPLNPAPSANGDIKLSPLEGLEREIFDFGGQVSFPDQGKPGVDGIVEPENPSCSTIEEIQTPPLEEESFLCHHSFSEPLSAVEQATITEALASHSIYYVRALLAEISQIVYHQCRQVVAGLTSAAQLTGMLTAKLLPILDSVRYSCHWAERQMRRWWGTAMSATTFRRIRDELEVWGCFKVDRVAPGSTHQITALRELDLPKLLLIASMAFQRLSSAPDGWLHFVPGHRCGFLASLWRMYFPGTFYAPASDDWQPDTESKLAAKRSDLAKARELQEEHGFSPYLSDQHRAEAEQLQRQIINLETLLAVEVTQ